MATVSSGSSATQYLSAGQYLSVTTAFGAEGYLDVNPAYGIGNEKNTRGRIAFGPLALAAQQFGPFGSPVAVTVKSTTGGITYSVLGEGFAYNSSGRITGLVDGDGNAVNLGELGLTVAVFGDSLTAYNNQFFTPTSISRSGNVATVTATSHGLGDQNVIRVCGCGDYNTEMATATRTGANTFTYPSVGADGSATVDSSYSRVLALGWMSNASLFQYANGTLGLPLRLVNNYGNSGETTALMLLRISAAAVDMASRGVRECWVMAGSNDATGAVTAATTKANLQTIYQTLRAAGIAVRALTIPPLGSGHASLATATPKIIQVNEWIRQYCATRPGHAVADVFAAVVNPTASNGSALTNALQSDNIHWQTYGAYLAGLKIAASYNGQLPTVDRLTKSAADTYSIDAANPNIWAGSWANTGGTISDVVSGTAMDGVNVSSAGNAGRTAVASVVSRSDRGYNQRVVFTPAAANDSVTIQQESTAVLAARVAAGEKYRARFSFLASGVVGANVSYFRCRIQGTFGGTVMVLGTPFHSQVSGSGNVSSDIAMIQFESPELVIPSGACTSLSLEVIAVCSASGTALTMEVGLISIDRVDTSA